MIGVKFLLFLCLSLSLSLVSQAGTKEFSVNKNEGYVSEVFTFDGSGIKQAKKFIWSFGNGVTATSTHPVFSYQYTRAGTYTASLVYQVNASEKNPNYKSGGSVVVSVKDATPKPNIAPTADISCSVNYQLVACSGLASFDPENQPLTFTFDYEDGFSETNTTGLSSHAYAAPGLYNVRLSVYDSAGASGVATIQVQAVKPPNKLPVLALNCSSDVINTLSCNAIGSTDPDGSIFSYSYAWDDGESDSKADASVVSHAFSTSGSHAVTLTAIDNEGAISTLTKSFDVKANTNPVASFNCDASKPLQLICTSTSTDADTEDAIQDYSWKFGANAAYTTTSSTTDYSFQSGGEVAVTLVVKDSFGGMNSLSKNFTVKDNQLPSFDFKADVLRGVAPLKVHFQVENILDTDGSIASTEIKFGDETTSGASDVFHTYQSPGTYNVVATVSDDLGGTSTKTIQIVAEALIESPPQAFFKIFQFETKVELHATLTKTQYEIKRAFYTVDGSETVELAEFYPNTVNWVDLKNYGHHDIKLTVEDIYGQQSSFTHSFELGENLDSLKPYTDFVVKQSAIRTVFINLNRSFDFDIDQPIQSFRIDLGNGQSIDTTELYVTYTYPASGTYPITVTSFSSHGTQSSVTKEFTVTDENTPILSPTANFGYRIYDFAQNVSFYNERSGTPNGTILSYIWDFGDGSVGTGQKVSHFYNPGSYLVTLTVVDSAGLQSSQTQHVTIFGTGSDLIAQIDCNVAEPYFDFTQTCQVMALDKLNQISRVRVTWGDGTVSVLPLTSPNGIFKPTHKYSVAGNFPVNLTVTTTRGEVKTAATNLNLTKYNPITADIQCTTNNLLVSCNALGSYDIYGRQLSYVFDFGDSFIEGNTFGVSTHAYDLPGSYTVTVDVYNSDGEKTSIQTQVFAFATQNISPVAGVNCYSSMPLTVICDSGSSYDSDGTVEYVEYVFDDGTSGKTSPNEQFEHTFLVPGEHSVSIKAVDNDGGVSSIIHFDFSVNANLSPVAMMACQFNENLVFCSSLTSFDVDGQIVESIWDFGDGTVLIGPTVSHRFTQFGHYEIKLTVKDDLDASSSVTQVFPITGFVPVAAGSCESKNLYIHCTGGASTDYDGEIVKWSWSISNEPIQVGETFDYQVTSSGVKEIYLEVEDNFGNLDRKYIATIEIYNELPVAKILCDKSSEKSLYCDASFSISGTSPIIKYIWNVNGESFEGPLQVFNFSEDGIYQVSLTVQDKFSNSVITTEEFEFTPSLQNALSNGLMSLAESSSWFYSTNAELIFTVQNALINRDTLANVFTVNGNHVDSDSIAYDFEKSTITISSAGLIEGKNELLVKVRDNEGKEIDFSKVIWAGTKTVVVEFSVEDGFFEHGMLSLAFSGEAGFKTKKFVQEESVTISNFPSIDTVLSFESQNFRTVQQLTASEVQTVIHLAKVKTNISTSNYKFENGLEGWSISEGNVSVTEAGLVLQPRLSGDVISLSNVIRPSSSQVKGVRFEFDVATANKSDFYYLKMKNLDTGKEVIDYSTTEDIADVFLITGQSTKISKFIEVKTADDRIEIFLSIGSTKLNNSQTSIHRFFSHFIGVAHAEDLSTIRATVRGIVNEEKIALGTVGMFDGYSLLKQTIIDQRRRDPSYVPNEDDVLDYSLAHLSVGKYPNYGTGSVSRNDLYASVEYAGDLNLIRSAELKVSLKKTGQALTSEKILAIPINNKIGYSTFSGDMFIFHFNLPSQINLSEIEVVNSKYLDVKIALKVDGEASERILTVGKKNFKPLMSLTSYTPNNSFNSIRFENTSRELVLGGDDWVDPQELSMLEYYTFLFNEDPNLRVTYNDFSKMNGGYHPDHSSHKAGNIFDGRFEPEFSRGNASLIESESAARKLIKILATTGFGTKVRKVLVTYRQSSPFMNFIKASCLIDGRLGSDVVRYYTNHKDHFHVEFNSDLPSRLRSSGPERFKSYKGSAYGALKFKIVPEDVSPMLNPLNIKESELSNLPFIDNLNYAVWAKAQKSIGDIKKNDWVKLVPDSSNKSQFYFYKGGVSYVPIENVLSLFTYKVVRMKSNDCTESAEQEADISPYVEVLSNEASQDPSNELLLNVKGFADETRAISIVANVKYTLSSEYNFSWQLNTASIPEYSVETAGSTKSVISLPVKYSDTYSSNYFAGLRVQVKDVSTSWTGFAEKLLLVGNIAPAATKIVGNCNSQGVNQEAYLANYTVTIVDDNYNAPTSIPSYCSKYPNVINPFHTFTLFCLPHRYVGIDEVIKFVDARGGAASYLIKNPCLNDTVYDPYNEFDYTLEFSEN